MKLVNQWEWMRWPGRWGLEIHSRKDCLGLPHALACVGPWARVYTEPLNHIRRDLMHIVWRPLPTGAQPPISATHLPTQHLLSISQRWTWGESPRQVLKMGLECLDGNSRALESGQEGHYVLWVNMSPQIRKPSLIWVRWEQRPLHNGI